MQDEIARLRQFMVQGPQGDGPSPLDMLFARFTPPEAVRLFVKACKGLSTRELNFQVFLRLKARLQRDEALLLEMTHLIADRTLDESFRLVMMDFVDGAARHKGAKESYWKTLRQVCTSEEDPLSVRTQALHKLRRNVTPATTRLLRDMLLSDEPTLLNAAANVVHQWHSEGLPTPRNAAAALAAFVRAAPRQALQFPCLLRALAELRSPEGEEALRILIEASHTTEELAMLLGATGAALNPRLLHRLERHQPVFTWERGVPA